MKAQVAFFKVISYPGPDLAPNCLASARLLHHVPSEIMPCSHMQIYEEGQSNPIEVRAEVASVVAEPPLSNPCQAKCGAVCFLPLFISVLLISFYFPLLIDSK